MQNKRILIHGATNTSNFGDVLFAHLFYRRCGQVSGAEVHFLQMPKYGVGSFVRKELGYTDKLSLFRQLRADALVLMSGGYLGEDKRSFRNTVKRYFRYIFPARLFQMRGKPVYVLGVGGGQLFSPFLRRAAVKLLNRATVVMVRDEETKNYFAEYGVTREILVTSDTAQVITPDTLPPLDETTRQTLAATFGERKLIFLHTPGRGANDTRMAEVVIPALNLFLRAHPEYGVVLGTDGCLDHAVLEQSAVYRALDCDCTLVYDYASSWQLCALLNRVDLVVTSKLHVGIVSSALGKSVVSFPAHREKVQRYYRQIGETERSIHLSEADTDTVLRRLERYYDKPIVLSEDIRQKALANLQAIARVNGED